jgi:hypothetical protein
MSDIGKRQESVLYFALLYEKGSRKGGPAVPITALTEAFFDLPVDDWGSGFHIPGEERRAALFRTRRAVKALIARGLMEEAGTAVSVTGDHGSDGGRHYKGYTRVCRAYRLTKAGRALTEKIEAEVEEQVKATKEARPELREIAESIKAAVSKL